MWVILLIALLLCFVINPILGIVIVVLGILGFFGLIFLMCLADTKKKNLDDTLNGYKFWRLGKVYTCSLSVSGDKGFEACKIALGKRGVGKIYTPAVCKKCNALMNPDSMRSSFALIQRKPNRFVDG